MQIEWLEPPAGRARTLVRRVATALVLCIVAGALATIVKSFTAKPERAHKIVHQIVLLRPPPPKRDEKPPAPEPERDEVKLEEKIRPLPPPPDPDEAPPALKPLGLDADSVGPGDGFGLIANKGGTDLLGSERLPEGAGSNGTGTVAPAPVVEPAAPMAVVIAAQGTFRSYAARIQSELQDRLSHDDSLQGSAYRVTVRLWFGPRGAIARVELADSTGDARTDERIRAALSSLGTLAEAPPADLPQPLRVRITSRL